MYYLVALHYHFPFEMEQLSFIKMLYLHKIICRLIPTDVLSDKLFYFKQSHSHLAVVSIAVVPIASYTCMQKIPLFKHTHIFTI